MNSGNRRKNKLTAKKKKKANRKTRIRTRRSQQEKQKPRPPINWANLSRPNFSTKADSWQASAAAASCALSDVSCNTSKGIHSFVKITGKLSVRVGALLQVFGSRERHTKFIKVVSIPMRPIPKEDTLCR